MASQYFASFRQKTRLWSQPLQHDGDDPLTNVDVIVTGVLKNLIFQAIVEDREGFW